MRIFIMHCILGGRFKNPKRFGTETTVANKKAAEDRGFFGVGFDQNVYVRATLATGKNLTLSSLSSTFACASATSYGAAAWAAGVT